MYCNIGMTMYNHYIKEKQRFLENCLQCGLCAQACPILPHTNSSKDTYQKIQEQVFHFIDKGLFSKQAYTKAFSCMECFKCTNGVCPEGLNPMLINELIKQEYISCRSLMPQQEPSPSMKPVSQLTPGLIQTAPVMC